MLFKLDEDGSVRQLLLYPETKLGLCARESLANDRFVTLPPRGGYWGGRLHEAEVSSTGSLIPSISAACYHLFFIGWSRRRWLCGPASISVRQFWHQIDLPTHSRDRATEFRFQHVSLSVA